jgi:hypothetical protein
MCKSKTSETRMKTFFTQIIFWLALLIGGIIQSQSANAQVSGKLIDKAGEPVPFANVVILQAGDSSIVMGAVSDPKGLFSFTLSKPGLFMLKAAFVGYSDFVSEILEVKSLPFTKDFGSITLLETALELEGVQVSGSRPQVIMDADKMVVDVENSSLAMGNSALDVLEKSPGVIVDQDGNVTLNGRQGTRVMIDGRPTYLSPKELQNYLAAMSSENIKSIEIITNPSARYDAEGTSGIIDIRLKKNTIVGMNGSLNAGNEYNDRYAYFGGLNLNYKTGKWATFANFDYNNRKRVRTFDVNREFLNEAEASSINQLATFAMGFRGPNVRAGADYEINSKQSIGVMGNFVKNDGQFSMISNTNVVSPLSPGMGVFADNRISNQFGQRSFNLHYVNKLDSLGSSFSVDADYSGMEASEFSTFSNTFLSFGDPTGVEENLRSDNPTQYDIYSIKADYLKKWANKMQFEAGAKFSRVISDNEVAFALQQGETWELDPLRSNHFVYKENIYAAYGNFKTNLGKDFKLQTGLRAEKTDAEGYSITLDERTPRNYLNLFPSVFLSQTISKSYSINYSYSRRIFRPPYRSLNPFILYVDPYTFIQGNPYLRPNYANSFELTQSYKSTYHLTLSYQKTNDIFEEVPFQNNEDRTTTFRITNIGTNQDLSARVQIPVEVNKWWSINNTGLMRYRKVEGKLGDFEVLNEGWNSYAQSQHSFRLPNGFKLDVSGTFQGPQIGGVFTLQPIAWMDLGVKKTILDNKLDLALNANDVFRSRKERLHVDFQNQNTTMVAYNGFQSIRFSARYKFSRGEKFNVQNRRVGNQDELMRTGN